MFAAVAKSIFGSANDRYVRSLGKYVDAINGFEPNISALTDDELRSQTDRFRERLANGEKLDALLPEAFATVPEMDFTWTKGAETVKSAASSSFGHREFCGRCGTPFLMKVDHQPETVDFSVATLDDPEAIAPGFHIFWGSKIGWFEPRDELARHEKFRPDTRGLEGTEPPQ